MILVFAAVFLAAPSANASCVDNIHCVCRFGGVFAIGEVLERDEAAFTVAVRLDDVRQVLPDAEQPFSVGQVVRDLRSGAAVGSDVFLGTGATRERLEVFNEENADGSVNCSGTQFSRDEYVTFASSEHCATFAFYRGVSNGECDDVSTFPGCNASGHHPEPWWLAMALLPLAMRRRDG